MKIEIGKFNKSFASPNLVDHYIETELSDETEWRAQSARSIHADFLKRWGTSILGEQLSIPATSVRVAVEAG